MRTFLSAKKGHNLETEAKLNAISNEVPLNVGSNFQLIPSKDARKRTKNVHSYMQLYFIEKKTKNFHEISMIRCLTPLHWQMSVWFSLPQQWLMTTWNKQTSIILAQNSVAVLSFEGQNIKSFEKVVCKCLWFLLRRRFCRQNWALRSIWHLYDLQIFFITTLKKPEKENLEVEKHAGQQADPVSVHCLQTNEKPRDRMRIHLGCSTTHGHAKLVPHWILHFHQIFTSSTSSKKKTDKKFSYVFFRTWRRAKAKLVTARDNWRWILIRDDRNLSMHRRGLRRFKNSFSLLSFCTIFISVFLIWTAKNFFPFFC